jgi:hypothetical protein
VKALFRAVMLFALCAGLTGCAAPGASSARNAAANAIPAQQAKDAVSIGKSTKAEIIAALGKTTVISFDSGFEVWVYHLTAERAAAAAEAGRVPGERTERGQTARGDSEFVLLFNPAGIVTKTRIRPPLPGEADGR